VNIEDSPVVNIEDSPVVFIEGNPVVFIEGNPEGHLTICFFLNNLFPVLPRIENLELHFLQDINFYLTNVII